MFYGNSDVIAMDECSLASSMDNGRVCYRRSSSNSSSSSGSSSSSSQSRLSDSGKHLVSPEGFNPLNIHVWFKVPLSVVIS